MKMNICTEQYKGGVETTPYNAIGIFPNPTVIESYRNALQSFFCRENLRTKRTPSDESG
jgi:hypothetical protein